MDDIDQVSQEDLTNFIETLADHGRLMRSIPSHAFPSFSNFIHNIISPYTDPTTTRSRKDQIIKDFLFSMRIWRNIDHGQKLAATIRKRIQIVETRRLANAGVITLDTYDFEGLPFESVPDDRQAVKENGEDVDEFQKAMRKVIASVKSGSISRAAETIESFGITKELKDPIARISELYPRALNADPIPLLPDHAPDRNFPAFLLRKYVRIRARDNSGPGISGMSARIISGLVDYPELYDIIHQMINDIANGRIRCPYLRFALCSGKCHYNLTEEENKEKLRSLAPQEILYRLAFDYAAHYSKKKFNEFFCPLQFSMGAPGGAERASMLLQTVFESNHSYVLDKNDIRNAFGSVHRPKMFEILFSHPEFDSLWRLSHLAYSLPNGIVIQLKDGSFQTILADRGGLQGDPLYPFLFCLSTHEIMQKALSKAENYVLGVAVMDDFQTVGLAEDTEKVKRAYGEGLASIGLAFNPTKNKRVAHPDSPCLVADSTSIPSDSFFTSGIKQLGSRFGPRSRLDEEWVFREVRKVEKILDFISNPSLPKQVALLILRFCVISRVSYLMRTIPPTISRGPLQWLDDQILQCFCKIGEFKPGSLSPEQVAQIHVPIKQGGFGLPRLVELAPIAFVSSAYHVMESMNAIPVQVSDMISEYDAAVRELKDMDVHIPEAMDQAPIKLQHHLSEQYYNNVLDRLFNAASPVSKARWLSLSAKHSGAVLHAIPKAYAFTMTDREMKDFIHVRLGLGFSQEDGAKDACSACGHIFRDELSHIEHALTCQKMKKTTQLFRHNAIENQVAKSLKDVAFFVAHAPKIDDAQPDLEFCFREEERPTLLEVSVTHPSTASNLSKNHSDIYPRSAAKSREREKTSKYRHLERSVIPIVVETYGAFGPQFTEFLKLIARKKSTSSKSYNSIFNDLTSSIQCALQRGNSTCISRCVFGAKIL
jgi:hypothetical protein